MASSAPDVAPLTRTAKGLAGAFVVSGVLHLVKPEVFARAMPARLPAHRELIVGSGVAELVCAAGLALPRTRRAAGLASAALLVGVFPANVKMWDDARRSRSTSPAARAWRVGTLARLPLQAELVRTALRAGR